jgi:hypothetical protein
MLNFILFLFILIIAVISVGFAVVITAFSGSGRNPPTWYFLYLGLTQGIPIIAYSLSMLIVAFSILMDEQVNKKIGSIIAISFFTYILSFIGLLLCGETFKMKHEIPNPSFKWDS